MFFFYDWETTGFAHTSKPVSDDCQPHGVQIGIIVTDDQKNIVAEFNAIIQPDGWEIPENVVEIHGISTQKALQFGIPLRTVIAVISKLAAMCHTRIAHNDDFDSFITQVCAWRAGMICALPQKRFCTMRDARNLVKIAPTDKMMAAGRKEAKAPNLQELHNHFFGCDFDNAHSAMADVRAMVDCYFAMFPPPPLPEPTPAPQAAA